MEEKWNWFAESVKRYIEPILVQYHFVLLKGKGYEQDDSPYENDPISKSFDYENEQGEHFSIEILVRHLYQNEYMKFYLLRVWLNGNLKPKLSISSDIDYLDNVEGWGFKEPLQFDKLIQEIARELPKFLTDK